MDLEQIYKGIDNIIVNHIMLNDKAMQITQSLGFNGFKRFHRYNETCLLEMHQCLENWYFDRYQKVLNVDVSIIQYNPIDLKAHLSKWKILLETDMQTLGELNQEHFDLVGISNCIIDKLIYKFSKHYEKICRYLKRFEASNWDSLDCHIVDDYLHKKIKEKEGDRFA